MALTPAQKALKSIGACSPAVRWINGHTPAKAWKECHRPDWMLWLIRTLAQRGADPETRDYYARGWAACLSACIDVLVDVDCQVEGPHEADYWNPKHTPKDVEEGRKYAYEISTLLDKAAQEGRKPTRLLNRRKWVWLNRHYGFELAEAIDVACAILNDKNIDRGTHCLEALPLRIKTKICNEIRRLCERPTLTEVKQATRG